MRYAEGRPQHIADAVRWTDGKLCAVVHHANRARAAYRAKRCQRADRRNAVEACPDHGIERRAHTVDAAPFRR